jgi:soluble lytic murein transglycosylase
LNRRVFIIAGILAALTLAAGAAQVAEQQRSTSSAKKKAAAPSAAKQSASRQSPRKSSKKASAHQAHNIAPKRQFTLAGSGLQPAGNPLLADPVMSALRSVSKPFLDSPTLIRRRELERFAARYSTHAAGALAFLALGYSALEGKRYEDAAAYLKAGRAIQSPAPDYFDYYLAASLEKAGRQREALTPLEGFEQHYPNSSLMGRAVLARAAAWIATGRAPDAAALLKSRLGALKRPDADLLLGRAYEASDDARSAAEAYRRAYFLYPTTAEADEAGHEVVRLQRQLGGAMPAVPIDLRKQRADLLLGARQFRRAAEAYRDLAEFTSGAEHERALVGAAAAGYRARLISSAYATLSAMRPADPAADAERLYYLGECQRHMSREDAFLETVRRLSEAHPDSPWYEEALFSAGNYFLLKRSLDDYARYYQTLYQRFPSGKNAALAHWRVAWKHYRTGSYDAARRLFEEQVIRYPDSQQVAAALYWLGKLAEKNGPGLAQTYYRKASRHFPQYFYGTLARQRLMQLAAAADPPLPPNVAAVIAAIPEYHPSLAKAPRPADFDEHRRKVQAFELTGLLDLAVIELRTSTDDPVHNQYLMLELARLERDRGNFRAAIEYVRRVYPNYFAFPFEEVDRSTWELLFPLPWWSTVQANALLAGLDPYLVMALIRQESAFSPWAVSSAHAYGLAQLLPSTARKLSPAVGRKRRLNTSVLFDPVTNIQLGVRYLTQVLEHYGGRLEPALASYNAGPDRVDVWLAEENTSDPAQFVESIPFTETREYVQAVFRNAAIYRRLYASK